MFKVDGHLERLSRRVASGWVWCPQRPHDTLLVSAVTRRGALGHARADRYRRDLALHGKRQGRCGFAVPLPPLAVTGRLAGEGLDFVVQRLVRGRLGPRQPWLSLADEERAALATVQLSDLTPISPAPVIAAIDRLDHLVIAGWCCSAVAGERAPIALELYVDDVWQATVWANNASLAARARLGRNGAVPGQRFSFATPPQLRDGRPHSVAVTLGGASETLLDGPHQISLPPHPSALVQGFAMPPLPGSRAAIRPVSDGPRRGEYERWIAVTEDHEPSPVGPADTLPQLIATRGARALAEAVQAAGGEWVALCAAGDVLARDAIARLMEAVQRRPGTALAFADEDVLAADGSRRRPRFKPAYCPDLCLTHDLFTGVLAVRRDLALAALAREPCPFDGSTLALKVARSVGPEAVSHSPQVLTHRPVARETRKRRRARFVADLLAGEAKLSVPLVRRTRDRRVLWPLPKTLPLTSIIIPTKDRAGLFVPLATQLLRTLAIPLELVLVDNDSVEPATFAAFERLGRDGRVRIVRSPDPFNFSAANNLAVRAAQGAVLVFMNNDVALEAQEGAARALFDELLRQVLRPDVGVVGARLAYADGSNQHAGVGLGIGGVASHLLRQHTDLARADHGRFRHAQSISAVTAALMAMRRGVFEAVGGFEEALPLAYNDVDLCLKVRAQTGLRVVYTPHARAYHLESQSRGRDDTPQKRARLGREKAFMRERWGEVLKHDPHLSPHHARTSRDLRLHLPEPRTAPADVAADDAASDKQPRPIASLGEPGEAKGRPSAKIG